jgi:hypothetical protein
MLNLTCQGFGFKFHQVTKNVAKGTKTKIVAKKKM